MNSIYHYLGAHKNIWRFRLIVAAIFSVFALIISFSFVTLMSKIHENVPAGDVRFAFSLSLLISTIAATYFAYNFVINSFSIALSDNTIKELSPEVLHHYKKQIDGFNLHRPITWANLYEYLRYLMKTQKGEIGRLRAQNALSRQKTCINDLVV